MSVPGWYPDAQNGSIVRWWDGQAWTAHTQPMAPAAPAGGQPLVFAQATDETVAITDAQKAVLERTYGDILVLAGDRLESPWTVILRRPSIEELAAYRPHARTSGYTPEGRPLIPATSEQAAAAAMFLSSLTVYPSRASMDRQIARWPTLLFAISENEHVWRFVDPKVRVEQIQHRAPAPTPVIANVDERTRAAEEKLVALQRELESVEEAIEIQSFGFYRPKYGFDSSGEYASQLAAVRFDQEVLIKRDDATHCATPWTVDGSVVEGRRMVRQASKLMLRAFNGESDAAIAKARYDNVVTLERRITKSYEAINKLGESNQITITQSYYDLKLAELHLVHEHREKTHEEKEEQKRIREEMREEEKANEDIERLKVQAEKDESVHAKALAKARAELGDATGKQHEKLESLVARLENELKDALDRKAKAIARAQLTKSGHVYVLSNLGSFGEGVYKLGMTRRIEPLDRVHELGDASVPFPFDVHAMIYSENAPGLENALHREFASRRLNRVNLRREYFRVTLDEVRAAIEKHHALVTFVLTPEAEEWRKTQAMLDATPIETS